MRYGLAFVAVFAGAMLLVSSVMAEQKRLPGHRGDAAEGSQLKTEWITSHHGKKGPGGTVAPKPASGGGPTRPPGVIQK